MALIKCKECGKEVSDEAFVCPHCGYNFPYDEKRKEKTREKFDKKMNKMPVWGWLLIFLGIIVIGVFLSTLPAHSNNVSTHTVVIY
jgi:uncharacterized membrane protein YvbJ